MGITYEFKTEDTLDIDAIERLVGRMTTAFAGFYGFRQSVTQTATFHHDMVLPILGEMPGVTFGEVTLRGYLPSRERPFPTLANVMKRGDATAGWLALLGVEVGFVAKKTTGDRQDWLGVSVHRGKRYFSYESRGSRVAYDVRARMKFYQRLIRIAELPINLSAREDFFNLYHRVREQELWLAQTNGINKENPGAFRVQVPWASPDLQIERLQAILEQLADPHTLDPAWFVTTNFPGRMITEQPPGKQVYDLIAAGGYPADRLTVELQFTITRIVGTEAMRALCGPGDRFATFIGQLRLPEENYGEVEVVTTAAGHGLVITPRWPVAAEVFATGLGMALRK